MPDLKRYNTFFNWFFILYTVFGFYTMVDYGVPLDELTQRYIGRENALFIAGHDNHQAILDNGFFGPVLEVVDYTAENIIFSKPLGHKIFLRHIILFGIFLLAVRAFYSIAKSMSQVPLAAGLTTVMFALYPVLFAHAHYNSKDTFFLSLVIFTVYFMYRFIQSGNIYSLVFSALICGMAATVRLSGFFICAAMVLPMIVYNKSAFKLLIQRTGIYVLVFIAGFYLFYPYLWLSPIDGFKNLLSYVSQNPWPWNTLAAGREMVAGQLPWWYLGLWMGVTIPVLTIILFFTGIFVLIREQGLKPGLINAMILLIFIIPFGYFLVFSPTIYNGWRHLQFLIFPVSIFAVHALNKILAWKFGQYISWVAGGYSLLICLLWNPYGYAYFNEIYAIKGKPGTYDQDYWGLSALQGLRWVAAHDSSDSINISSFTESPELNALMLPEKDRNRFHFIRQPGTGDYEVEVRRDRKFGNLDGEVLYSICPLKDTIVRVVKLNKNQKDSL